MNFHYIYYICSQRKIKKDKVVYIAITILLILLLILMILTGVLIRMLFDDYDYSKATDYIYSTSSTELIELDYNNLPDEETTRLAIAEIYARYGQVFFDEDLNTYFNQFPWYRDAVEEAGGDYFSYYDLTPVEQYNVWLLEGLYEGTQDPSVF